METWLPIQGYEGLYEVSDLGRVRSIERVISQASRNGKSYLRTMKGVVLRAMPDSEGRYLYVHLGNKATVSRSVHSLVLRAFKGESPQGHEGCHGDGNARNNKLTNLRWDTTIANQADRRTHGTLLRGESHYAAVLTEDRVRQIKADLATYVGKHYGKLIAIAQLHGITSKHVGDIHRGKTWAHVI